MVFNFVGCFLGLTVNKEGKIISYHLIRSLQSLFKTQMHRGKTRENKSSVVITKQMLAVCAVDTGEWEKTQQLAKQAVSLALG